MNHVLDASAVLAVLLKEPGAERVEEILGTAVISSVNFSEVVAKLTDKGVEETIVRSSVSSFFQLVQEFDNAQALDAGLLRASTKERGLSLGDRACLALARSRTAVALTADKAWADLEIGIEIEVIR